MAHAAWLAAVHAESFPAAERWDVAAMAAMLAMPGTFGWLDAGGGLVLARVAADEAEILTLAVRPAARHAGLGRRLTGAAMAEAARRGAAAMLLEVACDNLAALALYAGCGFAAVGRRRGYYPGGGDALVLRAGLTPPCG